MPVVRYATLVALVVWLGVLQRALLGDRVEHLTALALCAGGVMMLGLLIMKFIGPPPHAFKARAVIAGLMLIVTIVGRVYRASTSVESASLVVTSVLGLALLSWYARE